MANRDDQERGALSLDPRDLIDRHAEQELFTKLVHSDSARVLTICDRGGRGKSSLLRRLVYNCRYEFRPAVPACMVELDRIDPSGFAVVSTIVNELDDVEPGMRSRFAKFAELDDARTLKDFSVFDVDTRSRVGVEVSGQATAGRVEGVAAGIYQHSGSITVNQRTDFTEEQEQRAQRRCVDAFFEDLRTVCATDAVAIVLDAWERCYVDLRNWISEVFLRAHCLNPNPNLRPAKLAVVVAGRPHAPVEAPHGLRPDEFERLFDRREDFVTNILSVRSLSEWEREHVRAFMVLNGCATPDDDDVDFIQSRLRKGWSLEKILTMIEEYLVAPR